MKHRVDYLDLAKGIGVFLVILGHMPTIVPDTVRMWIFSFHMPLFFIISGYFAKVPESKRAALAMVMKKTEKLLLGGT